MISLQQKLKKMNIDDECSLIKTIPLQYRPILKKSGDIVEFKKAMWWYDLNSKRNEAMCRLTNGERDYYFQLVRNKYRGWIVDESTRSHVGTIMMNFNECADWIEADVRANKCPARIQIPTEKQLMSNGDIYDEVYLTPTLDEADILICHLGTRKLEYDMQLIRFPLTRDGLGIKITKLPPTPITSRIGDSIRDFEEWLNEECIFNWVNLFD